MSDRVAVMRAGRIVQVGTPRALYERPASVFVARFLGRANILHGTVRAGGGGHPRLIETEIGLLPYDLPAAAGERGTVLIRPERITLVDTDLGQRSAVRPTTPGARGRYTLYGTLQDTSFRGIAALATVAVDGISLQVLLPAGRTLPAAGAPATVSFDPCAAVIPLAESH